MSLPLGTRVTLRPPHRSVRAQLRHRAPTLGGDGKANAWPWVKDLGLREEVIGQLYYPLQRPAPLPLTSKAVQQNRDAQHPANA